MPKASVKRSIECKKEQLIDLVLDIEKYPQFVPFCLNSKIYEKKEKGDLLFIIADLTIGKGPFKDTYKSDVQYNKKEHSISSFFHSGNDLLKLEIFFHVLFHFIHFFEMSLIFFFS